MTLIDDSQKLLDHFTLIYLACRKLPSNFDAVNCVQGKLRYYGQGYFLQIEDDVTHKLPDFTVSAEALCSALARFSTTMLNAEKIESKTKALTFSSKNSSVDIPIVKNDKYAVVDDIVLTPLLMNKYSVEVDAYSLWQATSAKDPKTLTSVEINDKNLILKSTDPAYGISSFHKIVYAAGEQVAPLKATVLTGALSWRTDNGFAELTLDAPDPNPVKISYKDDTKAQLSPLLLEYKNGVTVVVSRVWT